MQQRMASVGCLRPWVAAGRKRPSRGAAAAAAVKEEGVEEGVQGWGGGDGDDPRSLSPLVGLLVRKKGEVEAECPSGSYPTEVSCVCVCVGCGREGRRGGREGVSGWGCASLLSLAMGRITTRVRVCLVPLPSPPLNHRPLLQIMKHRLWDWAKDVELSLPGALQEVIARLGRLERAEEQRRRRQRRRATTKPQRRQPPAPAPIVKQEMEEEEGEESLPPPQQQRPHRRAAAMAQAAILAQAGDRGLEAQRAAYQSFAGWEGKAKEKGGQ